MVNFICQSKFVQNNIAIEEGLTCKKTVIFAGLYARNHLCSISPLVGKVAPEGFPALLGDTRLNLKPPFPHTRSVEYAHPQRQPLLLGE